MVCRRPQVMYANWAYTPPSVRQLTPQQEASFLNPVTFEAETQLRVPLAFEQVPLSSTRTALSSTLPYSTVLYRTLSQAQLRAAPRVRACAVSEPSAGMACAPLRRRLLVL
jgi:hypothetical protein